MRIREFIATILVAISTAGVAEEYGDWTVGFGQGYLEHTVKNGPGNEFDIACDVGATMDHARTGIIIEIVGKSPPPQSTVRVILDGDEISLFTDDRGTVTTDCRVCAQNFEHVWGKIRKSKTMLVQLADGRSSKFSLNGAKRALEPKPCKNWMRQ